MNGKPDSSDKKRAGIASACVFSLVLSFQLFAWHGLEYVDQGIWSKAADKAAAGQAIGKDDLAFGYPGSSFLIPAGFLVRTGMAPDGDAALRIALPLILSLIAAAIAYLSLILRPGSPWWLAAVGSVAWNPLYVSITPPTAVVSALAPLLVLAVLYAAERKTSSAAPFAWLGVIGALMLASRLDVSALMLVCALAYLWFASGRRGAVITALSALAVFAALNLPIILSPFDYATGYLEKVSEHYAGKVADPPLWRILMESPLAVVAMAVSAALLAGWKKLLPVPRTFLFWLFGTTALVAAALLSSSYHPLWYFYPLFFAWEALCLLFVFAAVDEVDMPQGAKAATLLRVKWGIAAFLVATQLIIFYDYYATP